jgi:hypothetical protein
MHEHDLRAALEAMERDPALWDPARFGDRARALEWLEGLDRLGLDGPDRSSRASQRAGDDAESWRRAADLRRRLEAVDARLVERLRAAVTSGELRGAPLRAELERLVGPRGRVAADEPGYDILDTLVGELLATRPAPAPTGSPEPGMVPYQPTPARVVLALLDRADLAPGDVLVDIGSGLGQVALLAHLLAGVPVIGIEVEPAYCAHAAGVAADLRLDGVTFVHADARGADYAGGSVFFLYTPCEGAMLQQVLDRLRRSAGARPVRVFTYGPCTPQVAAEPWLEPTDPDRPNEHRLAGFRSR